MEALTQFLSYSWRRLPKERNWDLSDPDVRYKVWRKQWAYLLLGWTTNNSLSPQDPRLPNRLWLRIEKDRFYDVVVFL